MKWHQRLRVRGSGNVASVLAVTVSVQGIVVASQFLVAFTVEPEQLGVIRWLESAFAIALLASSCGMPSVAFREAALCNTAAERTSLLLRASVLASASVMVLVLAGVAAAVVSIQIASAPAWLALIPLAGALWPANIARIGAAIIQGGQLSKTVWGRFLAFSGVAVTAMCVATWLFGVRGWVVGRYGMELGLAVLVVYVLWPARPSIGRSMMQGVSGLRSLFWLGTSANFAFLFRAVADNLPVLLLKRSGPGGLEELGWYGFASLALFLPTLILSVLMQANLPRLVQAVDAPEEFNARLSQLQALLLSGAAIGSSMMVALAMLVYWEVVPSAYSNATWALLILGASLPFRALILTAGAAAVARVRYAISSILAAIEILFLAVVALSGNANAATEMALAVFGASALSVLPALILMRVFRRRYK